MHGNIENPADLRPALAAARDKLERFEQRVLNRHVMVRLRTQSPLHPFLLFRFFSLVFGVLFIVASIGIIVAPLFGREIAQRVLEFEAMFSGMPAPAVPALLAAGCLLFALCAHLAALVAGRSAALLPHEARQHQRLMSDVKRLEAQLAVSSRLTPSPADRRAEALFR